MELQKLFQGRLNRSNFLLGSAILFAILGTVSKMYDRSFIEGILALIGIAAGVSLYIRRLHDLGKSGWWTLITLIPIVNFFFFFWLVLTEGMSKKNEFGPIPGKKVRFPQDLLVLK